MLQHVNKIKKNILILAFFMIAYPYTLSCNDKLENIESKQNEKTDQKISVQSAYEKKFVYSNSGLELIIEITDKSEDEINFCITSKNLDKDIISQIKGIAKLKMGDIEFDEDSEGNSYEVNEYIYKSDKCYLAIRVDNETKKRVRIIEADSSRENKEVCPFNVENTLNLI